MQSIFSLALHRAFVRRIFSRLQMNNDG